MLSYWDRLSKTLGEDGMVLMRCFCGILGMWVDCGCRWLKCWMVMGGDPAAEVVAARFQGMWLPFWPSLRELRHLDKAAAFADD